MITLSLCMIVKNEEDVLARCLSCAKLFADEIIIVDTGSTDRTKEIAKQFTSQRYDFAWCEDFSAARNFSFSKATMDYTMWLDADDIIDEKNCRLLLKLKQELDAAVDMVMMNYDVAFDSSGNPTLSYYRERIFKTARNYRWVGEIHEVIPQSGVVIHRDISVKHQKVHPTEAGRNLRIFDKMLADGKSLDPRQSYYYGRELMFNGRIEEAVQRLTSFLADGKGWVENNINACKDLAQCHYMANNPGEALESLLKSFAYDVPRAELCCDLGMHFFDRGQYRIAAYWYETASNCEMDTKSGAFCLPDCYGYLPYMQLCVCCDRLGEHEKAIAYNEKAGKLKPNDNNYLYNKQYFEDLMAKDASAGD